MLWTGSIEELRDFLEFINKQHKFIKFTSEFDQETRSVPFLDMQVSINAEGKIVTDLYKKKTARVQYLLPSSCHPRHVTENIPYSLAYRLLRLCSNRDTFTMRLQELRQDLISRDYHPRVISSAFERVCQLGLIHLPGHNCVPGDEIVSHGTKCTIVSHGTQLCPLGHNFVPRDEMLLRHQIILF